MLAGQIGDGVKQRRNAWCSFLDRSGDSVSHLVDSTDEPKLQTDQRTALAQNEACLSGVERGANDIAPLSRLRRQ